MNLYLIRHGESLGNINPQSYYDMYEPDIPLTDKGRWQANECHLQLPDNYLMYYSPYDRAKETADIIHRNSGRYTITFEDPLLVERAWGQLRENITDASNKDKYFKFFYKPEGGESFFDCYQRVVLFFHGLMIRNIQSNVVIISHGEWIRLALMYLDGTTVEQFEKECKVPGNCEIIKRKYYDE